MQMRSRDDDGEGQRCPKGRKGREIVLNCCKVRDVGCVDDEGEECAATFDAKRLREKRTL